MLRNLPAICDLFHRDLASPGILGDGRSLQRIEASVVQGEEALDTASLFALLIEDRLSFTIPQLWTPADCLNARKRCFQPDILISIRLYCLDFPDCIIHRMAIRE